MSDPFSMNRLDEHTRPAVGRGPLWPPEFTHPGLATSLGSPEWSEAYHAVVALHWDRFAHQIREGGYADVLRLRDSLASRIPDPYPSASTVARQVIEFQRERRAAHERVDAGGGGSEESIAGAGTDVEEADWFDSPMAGFGPDEAGDIDISAPLTNEGDELIRFRLSVLGWVLDNYEIRGLVSDYTEFAQAEPDPLLPVKRIIAEAILEHIGAGSPTAVMGKVAETLVGNSEVEARIGGTSDTHLKKVVWPWAGCEKGQRHGDDNIKALRKWAKEVVRGSDQ